MNTELIKNEINNASRNDLKTLMSEINETQRNLIYNILQFDYIKEDIENIINDNDDIYNSFTEEDITICTKRFISGKGKYSDGNLSHWDNIENIMSAYAKEKGYIYSGSTTNY